MALRCALQTDRRVVKFTGIGNVRERTLWYASLEHFRSDIPTLLPRARHDCLVAQGFMHEEFVSERTPKVYFSREPWEGLTEETRRNVVRADLARYIVSFAEADIDRRMFYVVLPEDRRGIVRKLSSSLSRKRPKLCCIVSTYKTSNRQPLLQERLRFVRAMGQDIDIYGRNSEAGTSGWNDFPTYRGPVRDKLHTLTMYDFNLCLENTDADGYITEKVLQALRTGCIPLYWGGGGYLKQSIPSSCFIDCKGRDAADVYQRIRTMSQDEIVEYRKAGLAFLASSNADRFTWRHWADLVAARLRAQSGPAGT